MFKKVFGTKNKGEVETSLIEQFWYPKYGPGQLWETAAEKVKELGGKILTGCQVKKIMCEGRKVTSVVCDTAEGEKTFTGHGRHKAVRYRHKDSQGSAIS